MPRSSGGEGGKAITLRLGRYLKDRAARIGAWPGHRGYRRFVVLAAYRTGSNFLLSLLRSHPAVVCFSEVFAPRQIYWGEGIHVPGGRAGSWKRLRGEDPAAFLDGAVFRRYVRSVAAVGFKMMYTHAEKEHLYPGIGRYLVETPDLAFIHLRRRNLLRILVSSRIATLTGSMSSRDEAASRRLVAELPRIRLEEAECRQHFERLEEFGRTWEERLAVRTSRQIWYEDLTADPTGVVSGLQEFLGVPVRAASTPLLKQGSRRLGEIIENYEELRAAFSVTPWAEYFDET